MVINMNPIVSYSQGDSHFFIQKEIEITGLKHKINEKHAGETTIIQDMEERKLIKTSQK